MKYVATKKKNFECAWVWLYMLKEHPRYLLKFWLRVVHLSVLLSSGQHFLFVFCEKKNIIWNWIWLCDWRFIFKEVTNWIKVWNSWGSHMYLYATHVKENHSNAEILTFCVSHILRAVTKPISSCKTVHFVYTCIL